MHRSRTQIVAVLAVLAVLAQLVLGAPGHLGLVLCIGDDHAAIELGSDDCCEAHGTVGRTRVAMIERDCCSDIPLYSAARALSEPPRPSVSSMSVATLPLVAVTPNVVGPTLLVEAGGEPPPRSPAARTVVLRV